MEKKAKSPNQYATGHLSDLQNDETTPPPPEPLLTQLDQLPFFPYQKFSARKKMKILKQPQLLKPQQESIKPIIWTKKVEIFEDPIC